MKKLLMFVALCSLCLLAACGSKQYMITTTNGVTYVADGAPEYDVHTETYTFKDQKGKKVIINQEKIEVIKEQ